MPQLLLVLNLLWQVKKLSWLSFLQNQMDKKQETGFIEKCIIKTGQIDSFLPFNVEIY